jgi:hypothetical protein
MTKRVVDSHGAGATPVPAGRGRALELLERVLSSDGITVEDVEDGLMVSAATLTGYRAERHVIPLEVQLLLVAFAIERVPQHGRLARRLREQIKATITFAVGETVTHLEPPPKTRW